MSEKHKKAKKEHSADGSENQDGIEVQPVQGKQQASSSIPPEQQLSISKKIYEKELARLQVELIKIARMDPL